MANKLQLRLRSETFVQLKQLLGYLPRKRMQGLAILLALAILLGLFDLVFVGLLARLVGALSGAKLHNKVPHILVFGGGRADQALWMACLLICLVWVSSALRMLVASMQAFLSAQVWSDYGNLIYSNILYQPLEYFNSQRSSHLLARLNMILGKVSDRVILPLLSLLTNLLSASVLMVGCLSIK